MACEGSLALHFDAEAYDLWSHSKLPALFANQMTTLPKSVLFFSPAKSAA